MIANIVRDQRTHTRLSQKPLKSIFYADDAPSVDVYRGLDDGSQHGIQTGRITAPGQHAYSFYR